MPTELAAFLTAGEGERLAQAEALVRGFCGWHIAPSRTETVSVRGRGLATLLLPSMRVTAVSSVTVDGLALTAEDDFTWSAAGVLTHAGRWINGKVVSVAMTHGYSTPPAEVTGVVQAVAQRAVDNPGSLVRTQKGPFSDTYSTTGSNQVGTLALLDSEKDALRRYRIPAVG